MKTEKYHSIIIGTGQAALPLSFKLDELGYKTAVIENGAVGGSCVNYGCTPTKTAIFSGRVAHHVKRSAEYGINVKEIEYNWKKVRARKSAIVKKSKGNITAAIKKLKHVKLITGTGSFESAYKVKVSKGDSEHFLEAENIYINTGTSPRIPEIDGLEDVKYLTNYDILDLDEVPEHLLIIGAGYLGLEFGQLFRRFGAKITIIENSKRLLKKEDEDIADVMQEILTEDGIEFICDVEVQKISKIANGVQLTLSNGKKVKGSHLLLAAGRVPNTKALKLENTKIKTDERDYIKANSYLETSVKNIFALGDVKGGPAFTNVSYDDFRYMRDRLDGKKRSVKDRILPYAMFTDPELGRVGINEQEAKELGISFEVNSMDAAKISRLQEMDESRGVLKVLVDPKSKKILGASFLCTHAGDLINFIQLAMAAGVKYTDLRELPFTHPSIAEGMLPIFNSFD